MLLFIVSCTMLLYIVSCILLLYIVSCTMLLFIVSCTVLPYIVCYYKFIILQNKPLPFLKETNGSHIFEFKQVS